MGTTPPTTGSVVAPTGRIKHGLQRLSGTFANWTLLYGGLAHLSRKDGAQYASNIYGGAATYNTAPLKKPLTFRPDPYIHIHRYNHNWWGNWWEYNAQSIPLNFAYVSTTPSTSSLQPSSVFVFGGSSASGSVEDPAAPVSLVSGVDSWTFDFAKITGTWVAPGPFRRISGYWSDAVTFKSGSLRRYRDRPVVVPYVKNNLPAFLVAAGETDSCTFEHTIHNTAASTPVYADRDTTEVNNWLLKNTSGSHLSGTGHLYPDGNSILLVGGKTAAGISGSVEKITLSNFSTVNLAGTGSLQTMRHSFAATVAKDGKLWVVGGIDSSSGVYLSSSEIFDFTTEQWATGPTLPQAVANGVLLAAEGNSDELILVGGDNGVKELHGYKTRVYAVGGPQWTTLADTGATARTNHRAVITNQNRVLAFGGEFFAGPTRVPNPFAREDLSSLPEDSNGMTYDPAGLSYLRFYTGTPGNHDYIFGESYQYKSAWPVVSATFSKVSMSNGSTGSWDAINDGGGLMNPGSVAITSASITWPTGSPSLSLFKGSEHELYMGLPHGKVMNGCQVKIFSRASVTPTAFTIQGIPPEVQTLSGSYLEGGVPTVSGSGSTTLECNGLWLDSPVKVDFLNETDYPAGTRFSGTLASGCTPFLTRITAPAPGAVAYQGSSGKLGPGMFKILLTYNVNGSQIVADPGLWWKSTEPVPVTDPELITNGSFSSGETGWTFSGIYNGTDTGYVNGGEAVLKMTRQFDSEYNVYDYFGGYCSTTFTPSVTKTHSLAFWSSGKISVKITRVDNGSAVLSSAPTSTGNKLYSPYLTAGVQYRLAFENQDETASMTTAYIDNVSVS